MVRAHDLAGDARVLYGPLSQRPTPAEAGSGALWVDPADQTLYHVQSGNWVTISPDAGGGGGGGGGGAGVPVLHGPYVVDYTDFAHDGDTLTLWTPQVGDVLLRLFYDWQAATPWAYTGGIGGTYGEFYVGQNPAFTGGSPKNTFGGPMPSDLSYQLDPAFNGQINDAAGVTHYDTAYVVHSTDPVQLLLAQTQLLNSPPGTPTAGHLELYALVARAVAP